MICHVWEQLPSTVRGRIQRQFGAVVAVELPFAGINSQFAATLHTRDQKLFCKGARTDHPNARMHYNEARVSRYLPDSIAPPLISEVEIDGWLLLVFRHVDGRHANFSPNSPDLPRIVERISSMGPELKDVPSTVGSPLGPKIQQFHIWRRFSEGSISSTGLDTWAKENLEQLVEWESIAPDAVAGEALLHLDLNPSNILVNGTVYFIDWACASRGAAWVDIAYMVPRLMAWGHSPQQAEEWARQMPEWDAATDTALTALAVNMAGIGEHRRRQGLLNAKLAAVARRWAQYRVDHHDYRQAHIGRNGHSVTFSTV